MYIDESGVPEITDPTKYFVTTGVIFHENSLVNMKRIISEFKDRQFIGKLKDAEIHLYDMYKGKKEFYGLTPQEIKIILDDLYDELRKIHFSIISIVINKQDLKTSKYAHYDILETGYTYLIERFDKFLRRTNNKGVIRIDKMKNKPFALSPKDTKILNQINKIRKHGTNWQTIENIVEEPFFIESHLRKGLQIADAVVYCVNRYYNQNPEFNNYWDILKTKMHSSDSGSILGYGVYHFP